MRLAPVDSLEVRILVDNVTDGLSSVPAFVETEWDGLWRGGMLRLGGRCLCCAAHGLSCLITLRRGDREHSLLFDSGPEDAVFQRNVERLGVDLAPVGCIVLSHGHWDHAGAMLTALALVRQGNGGRTVDFLAHPGMFRSRAMKRPDGAMRLMEDVPSVAQLTAAGARVVLSREPVSLFDGMALVSGEIPRVTDFERGLPGQHRRTEDDRDWEPDPLLMDERFVAVEVAGKGLVVFTACSHAGVINVLSHARAALPEASLHAVLGGLHLSGSNESIIPQTVAALRPFALAIIAAGHCTGWRALTALSNAFGDAVVAPLAVGKRYTF